MTADEALEEFIGFIVKVFKDIDPDPKRQTERLEQAIEDIIKNHGVNKAAKLIPSNGVLPMCRL